MCSDIQFDYSTRISIPLQDMCILSGQSLCIPIVTSALADSFAVDEADMHEVVACESQLLDDAHMCRCRRAEGAELHSSILCNKSAGIRG